MFLIGISFKYKRYLKKVRAKVNKEEEPPEQYKTIFNKGLEFVLDNLSRDEPENFILFEEAVSLFRQGRRISIESFVKRRDYFRLNSVMYEIFARGMSRQGYTTNNGEVKAISGSFQTVFDLYYALRQGVSIGEE